MKQFLMWTGAVITAIVLLSVVILSNMNNESLDDKFEKYLIQTYDLPENLEENCIYYESYGDSSGERITYTVYTNTKEEGIRIIDHTEVDVDTIRQY